MALVRTLDHLVLTIASIDRTCAFYCGVLGMRRVVFGEGRVALAFGHQKINLHQAGAEVQPNARVATPGSADLCFIAGAPLTTVAAALRSASVVVELGPVRRTGARGPITSLYVRDPDGNLIELSEYDQTPTPEALS